MEIIEHFKTHDEFFNKFDNKEFEGYYIAYIDSYVDYVGQIKDDRIKSIDCSFIEGYGVKSIKNDSFLDKGYYYHLVCKTLAELKNIVIIYNAA